MIKKLTNQCFLLLTILVFSGCDLIISKNNFNSFLIPARETNKGDFGFVNLDGEVVIDFDVDLSGPYSTPTIMNDGVSIYYDFERDNKASFIYNNNNEIEIKETDYINALFFSEGLALVVEEMQGLVYIDKEFNEVLKLDTDIQTAGYFIDGLAKFQDNTGKWGFIDKTGKRVIKAKYDEVRSFSEGYAVVSLYDDDLGLKKGIIDKTGNVVIKLKDKYSSLGGFQNGLSSYVEDDEIGFLNIKGQEVIKNDDWNYVKSFQNNGYSTFQEDFKWGLINMNGEEIIKNRYDNPLFFYNGLAPVRDDDGKWGFIDVNREEIIDYEYDEALPFLGKGAYVKDNKEWVFINKKDQQVGQLELTDLNTEWLAELIATGRPFDIESVVNSQYLAIDEFFSSTVVSFFDKTSIDEIINISVKDAVDEIKVMAQAHQINASDSLEKELSVYSNKVYSDELLNDQRYIFDNNFSHSLQYHFNDNVAENIIEKIQRAYYVEEKIVGQKPNLSTKLTSLKFYIHFAGMARNKGDNILEKVLEYFKSKGFSEDESYNYERYQMLQMSNEKMILKYYQSDVTALISINPSYSQEEYY